MAEDVRKKWMAGAQAAAVWLVIAAGALWAFGALWFDFPQADLRMWVAGGFGLAVVLILMFVKPGWCAKTGTAAGVVCVMVWWCGLQPRQHRDWKEGVAVLPHAVVEGDQVTIHQVRNFDYRSEEDFTKRYEKRRYELGKLRGVDLFINYWGSPFMAHPILSFDFGEQGRVCFSIETRMEKGESYSALGGLYRRFEQIYVVADERDVIRLRTNIRKGEDSYVYRLKAPFAKAAFLGYVRSFNELYESPRWYNAITNNCTTEILNQRLWGGRPPWDWRMLVNGKGDELLYERGAIDRSLPFEMLKRRSNIGALAKAADGAPDFSERIREGLPGMSGDL